MIIHQDQINEPQSWLMKAMHNFLIIKQFARKLMIFRFFPLTIFLTSASIGVAAPIEWPPEYIGAHAATAMIGKYTNQGPTQILFQGQGDPLPVHSEISSIGGCGGGGLKCMAGVKKSNFPGIINNDIAYVNNYARVWRNSNSTNCDQMAYTQTGFDGMFIAQPGDSFLFRVSFNSIGILVTLFNAFTQQ